MQEAVSVDSFTEWAVEAEPRIRQSLTAGFGYQVGMDATADALGFAWERWDAIAAMQNPVGYVYSVGRNRARRLLRRRRPEFVEVPSAVLPHVEPGLPAAIARLPERQRVAVMLVHGHGWTLSEVADLLGTKKTTVQNHTERGLAKLRDALGVSA